MSARSKAVFYGVTAAGMQILAFRFWSLGALIWIIFAELYVAIGLMLMTLNIVALRREK